ncbi:MAG: hypothetical protein ACK4TL_12750 [Hyphomicrobiaceae bacterium]
MLLVAGPSGVGKSTFIEQMVGGHLPDEIRRELPEGAATWPQLQGKHLRALGRTQPGILPDHLGGRLVAHYDTTYIIQRQLSAHEEDYAAEFFRPFVSLTIVSIETDIERLRKQVNKRRTTREKSRSLPRRLWARHVREPVRRQICRLSRAAGSARDADRYADPSHVETYLERWGMYMRSLVDGKPGACILRVEPAQDPNGQPTFQLVEKIMGA